MDTLLISYTTVDFRTKTEMELALRRWDENKEKWLKKFKDAGMTSNINTQIWNKEGVFRIGRIFMYKDEIICWNSCNIDICFNCWIKSN